MVSVSANNLVKSITPNMKVSYEGGVFRIRVNLSRRYSGRIPVSLTGSSPDIVGRRNWTLPKGVRWSVDGSALILSKSMTAFVLLLPVKNDALKENLERVRLTIGGKAVDLSIKDVPVAHVKETYSNVSRNEGVAFVLPVTLTRRSFYTSLPVALTGATDSVAARSAWTFSHGVKWNYNYSHLLIPPNVERFNVTIGSKLDSDTRPETLRLTLGDRTTQLQVGEPPFRTIRAIGRIVLVNRYSKRFTNVIKEGSGIEFQVLFSRGSTREQFFKISFAGQAFKKFNWKIDSDNSRGGYHYLGQGLFRLVSLDVNHVTIKGTIISDQNYFGRLAGVIAASPDNPMNISKKAISVDDTNVVIERARRYLGVYYKKGFTLFVKDLRLAMQSINSINGRSMLDEKMDNYKYLNKPALKMDTNGKTVKQFIQSVEAATAEIRQMRITAAAGYFNRLYTDLKIEAFNTSAMDRDGVLRDAADYLTKVSNNLSLALKNSIIMRQIMAEILGSYDEKEKAASFYLDANAPGSYYDLLKSAETRFQDYFDYVESQFERIREIFSQRDAAQKEALAMNIAMTVISGFATLASVGFAISNWRATMKQWSDARTANGVTRLTTNQFFDKAVNAPALAGSFVFGLTNMASVVVEALKAVKVGTPRLAHFNGEAKSFAGEFYKTTESLKGRLEKFEDAFLRMFHHILFNGGGGSSVERILHKTNVNDGENAYDWGEAGRNVFVNYDGFVVAWWSAPFGRDPISGKYEQYLWGIRRTPENTTKIEVKAPLVLDLTGGGFNFKTLSAAPVYDANHDGRRDRMAWIGAGTALLAYDVDGDGEIKRSDEISFVSYKEGAKTDLEGLTAFDSNGDSLFDGRDLLWHRFGVWQDVNSDGVNQVGEFVSLEQAGLSSISLVSDHMASTVGDVLIYGRSIFTRTDGTTGLVGDVGFRYISS